MNSQPAISTPISDSSLPHRVPWWYWLHMLSLEAPIIAVLWQSALAHSHGLHLMTSLTQGLALMVWVIYVLDRLADGVRGSLDVRHRLHHRLRGLLLVVVLPVSVTLLMRLAFWEIPEAVLWQSVSIAVLLLFYFLIYVIKLAPALLPKPHAAGLIFALGCTSSIRFLGMPETIAEPVLECIILALLFTSNLTAIAAQREMTEGGDSRRWRVLHPALLGFHVVTLAVILLFIGRHEVSANLAAPASASLCGLALLTLLHRFGGKLSSEAHRALADLAVVLPLPLLYF